MKKIIFRYGSDLRRVFTPTGNLEIKDNQLILKINYDNNKKDARLDGLRLINAFTNFFFLDRKDVKYVKLKMPQLKFLDEFEKRQLKEISH